MLFYKCFCRVRKNHVGKNTYIYYGGMMNECTIGDYVHIGPNCILNRTVIGNYSSIAPHVQIGGMEHPYEELSTSTFLTDNSRRVLTEIGHDVWIAAGKGDAGVEQLAHRVHQFEILLHHAPGLGHVAGIPLDRHFAHQCTAPRRWKSRLSVSSRWPGQTTISTLPST